MMEGSQLIDLSNKLQTPPLTKSNYRIRYARLKTSF
jgi:hypothetical protein